MPELKAFATILDEDDPASEQPANWKIQLRPHQLRMINRCLWLERSASWEDYEFETNIGAICDAVGSGKSYCALAIAAAPINKATIQYSDKGYTVKKREQHNNVNVIVVPHGLVAQWGKYLSNTSLAWRSLKSKKEVVEFTPSEQVVLVPSTQYRLFADTYAERCFARVFYDEADSINVPGCPKLRAKMYWLISATLPKAIMVDNHRVWYSPRNVARTRSLGFIRDVLTKLMHSDKSRSLIFIKNSDEIVERSIIIPPIDERVILCKSPLTRVLHNIVPSTTLTMLQAGDVAGVIKSYGAISVTGDNVIEVVCADLLKLIEDLKVDLESCERKRYATPEAKASARERITASIAEKEYKVELIQERVTNVELCPISYDEIKTPCILNCCKQAFELESIIKLIDASARRGHVKCPFCAKFIDREDIVVVSSGRVQEDDDALLSRSENVMKIMRLAGAEGKILIFSEYDATFEFLFGNGIDGRELKGSGVAQGKLLEWFADDGECKTLLLNSRNFGAGTNLEMATDLIIYHSMSTPLTTQVIGRAQRCGRKRSLRLWEFVDA